MVGGISLYFIFVSFSLHGVVYAGIFTFFILTLHVDGEAFLFSGLKIFTVLY